MKIRRFTVRENNREQQVIIPETGDKSYDDYLEQAEREKTTEQLRKAPPRPELTPSQKRDIGGAIKEFNEFKKRKERGETPKYF